MAMLLTSLGQSAQLLLDSFTAELTDLGLDVPPAQYVGAGQIPWDEPSLTVYLGVTSQGVPGSPTSKSWIDPSNIQTISTFYVQLLRNCSTVGYGGGRIELPSIEQLGLEGVSAVNDAGALYYAAIQIKAAGTLVPLGVDFTVGGVMPIGPEGGMSAMRIGLEFSLS